MFFAGHTSVVLAERANRALEQINNWASENDLKINVKTKAVMFHPRQKVFDLPSLVMNNIAIIVVRHLKTFKIIFAEDMSWGDQVTYVTQKLSRVAAYLRGYCSSFPISVNTLFYNSLFSSIMNYGALVWATATAENIDKLSRLQKPVIRIIAKAHYYSHTAELFRKFNIIRVHYTRIDYSL